MYECIILNEVEAKTELLGLMEIGTRNPEEN